MRPITDVRIYCGDKTCNYGRDIENPVVISPRPNMNRVIVEDVPCPRCKKRELKRYDKLK
jgi:hypothetical protein